MSNVTTSMGDSNDEYPSENSIWDDLVRWVQGEGKQKSNGSSPMGGHVHPALTLSGSGPSRGVKATAPITKGELLIRISSAHVLSGEAKESDDEAEKNISASPWLKCVGAFLKAKRNQTEGEQNSIRPNYGPYLNSLPKLTEYETLHNWSSQKDEVQSFLKGTTLGNLVALDRSTKGIQTRYCNSVEPYLLKVGAIVDETITAKENHADEEKSIENSLDYQAFLEASMCISTRGFHLMATNEQKDTSASSEYATPSTKSYDGPFLLPIIDLLNHDPQNACTTLKRHQSTEINGGSYFAMVAERDIAKGEEILHSYGSDLSSAQLLQTFGFVPRKHSTDALASVTSDPFEVSQSATPVGLSTKDHFIAASRALKTSSFPDTVIDRIRAENGDFTEGGDEYDEDDSFWEVCDIPDRPKMASHEEFLVSALQSSGADSESMLSEDLVTLMAAQFLPKDAFDEIFPNGDNASNECQLDCSILSEDYYLGMLVCKSILVALFLKARDYCRNKDDDDAKNEGTTMEQTDFLAKAISGAAPSGVVGKYIFSLLEKETSRIKALLGTEYDKRTTAEFREIYGRTIRIEEMTNLFAFCKEIEDLMATLSLGAGGDGHQEDDEDPPHKRPRVE